MNRVLKYFVKWEEDTASVFIGIVKQYTLVSMAMAMVITTTTNHTPHNIVSKKN
jgi:hypothetical protein